jgi:outer membrane lipoprotein carrier protein
VIAMQKTLLALAIAAAASFVAPARPADAQSQPAAHAGPTADEIVGRVQAFYNQTKTFQAGFKQEYTIKMHDQKRTSEGRVVFEKPGKMSWTYREPNGNRVVSDGKTLKVYEEQNHQMFEQPVDKSYYPAALSFLMGQGKLTESFELSLVPQAQLKYENGYVLEGKPKDATPAYQRVFLFVDAATAQVRRVTIVDAQSNRNTFTFDKPVVNMKVPPAEFAFEPPPGTQVIRP